MQQRNTFCKKETSLEAAFIFSHEHLFLQASFWNLELQMMERELSAIM